MEKPDKKKLPYIDVDSAGGIKLLMEELKKLKHRRIGFISGKGNLPMAEERLEGYLKAGKELRLDISDELVFYRELVRRKLSRRFQVFFQPCRTPDCSSMRKRPNGPRIYAGSNQER